jgi:RHS repeat-associated protein
VAHYSIHTDHQGSVRAVTDLTGGVVNSYAYDAYGNAEAAVESLPQRFRYTGREWDGVTRLYHYRARAYDPETGRFLQEDPLGFEASKPQTLDYFTEGMPVENKSGKSLFLAFSSELNAFSYVGANPIQYVDPLGTSGGEYGKLATIGINIAKGFRSSLKKAGEALADQIRRTYIKADVESGGKASTIAACFGGFVRGGAEEIISDSDPALSKADTLQKNDKFVREICNAIGKFFGGASQ